MSRMCCHAGAHASNYGSDCTLHPPASKQKTMNLAWPRFAFHPQPFFVAAVESPPGDDPGLPSFAPARSISVSYGLAGGRRFRGAGRWLILASRNGKIGKPDRRIVGDAGLGGWMADL
jgi:hypothetical protein